MEEKREIFKKLLKAYKEDKFTEEEVLSLIETLSKKGSETEYCTESMSVNVPFEWNVPYQDSSAAPTFFRETVTSDY